jgi:plastocyanin
MGVMAGLSPVAAADTDWTGENSVKAVAFRNDMRQLWEDHIIYTRHVIISVAAGLPDLNPALARLMQNQVDLGNAIKPYYGNAAGDQLTALLKDHISGAGEVLTAAKAGDNAKLANAQKRWVANANDIAAFLSAANPDNWPLATVQDLMKMHLDTTTEEAVARLKGDWAADIAAFDKVHAHILMMSDALSLGIIRQFPVKFTGPIATATGELLASCPVMGTTMPQDEMLTYDYEDATYYFCCAPCVAKFKRDPEQYIMHPVEPIPMEGEGDANPATVSAMMHDNSFMPKELTVTAGTTIKWTNYGAKPHTVTGDKPGGPNSGTIASGQSYQWQVPAGAAVGKKFYYHCKLHGKPGSSGLGSGMSGVIIVK